MEQSHKTGLRLLFILLVSAVFIAVAMFVAVAIMSAPPEPSSATASRLERQVAIEGKTISLKIDPDKAIVMNREQQPAGDTEIAQGTEYQIESADVQLETEPTAVPTSTPTPEPVIVIAYTVRQGDSLYSISAEQNSSIELMATYGVDAGDLTSGNTLNLPVANPSYCPGTKAYVVRDHDTLYGIARSFNTTVEAILEINNFQADHIIKVTEVICVPTA